jgi:hypothetical protein
MRFVELVAWLSVRVGELVAWLACAPESWTRAGHLFREKYSENTREIRLHWVDFCTARLSAYFSSRRTRLVTLFFAWFGTARVLSLIFRALPVDKLQAR